MGGGLSKPRSKTHSKTSSVPIPKSKEDKTEVKSTLLTIRQDPSEDAMLILTALSVDSAVLRIIMSYWNLKSYELEEIKQERPITINLNQTFFKQSSLPEIAAQYILSGHLKETLDIVRMNPEVLRPVIEATDPRGRRVKGTLLRIAAAAGSFNPFKMDEKAVPHGIVEHLARLLPSETVKAQLKEQFPPGWEKKTTARMERYVDAAQTFGAEILAITVPEGSSLKAECKPLIDKFTKALESDPEKVLTSGLIFDLQILTKIKRYFLDNKDNFGGWYSDKSSLFWTVGYGSLLGLASADDAHLIQHGIYNVAELQQLPTRSLKFTDGSSYYSSGLGSSFFIDELGRHRSDMALVNSDAMRVDWISDIRSTKKSEIKDLCSDRKVIPKAKP